VNSGVVEHPKLAFLGDVFAVPAQFPLANVFSVGDVLIILGVGMASWRICGTRWTRPWGVARHRGEAPRRWPAGGRRRGRKPEPAALSPRPSGLAATVLPT
jgi:hypothetical protein